MEDWPPDRTPDGDPYFRPAYFWLFWIGFAAIGAVVLLLRG